ncbi:hypothetical protein O3640_08140 [Streptococcus sp. 27098_8_75]|jgi:hypothetical protein|uniref:hypothetical protein n=1 Tax=Streptococcus TaxID=1301 RepID=UPI0007794886|nr:hypothetical protein [Streptococcus gordonii]MBZ2124268.1 hypothetical protein [Streptococcus gordonii]MCY7145365.1 hypothetical protein [Streptococcus gordonii]RKV91154.1 MAG: hypothetical protein D8H99_32070 [Streptococcus sp.]
MSSLDRYKPINIPDKFNRPIQTKSFPIDYEELHLSFYDVDLVKDLIDFWGLLYREPKKDSELKYIDLFRDRNFQDEDHRKNAIKKATRQEARQPFFDELTTKPLKKMSENVRWVAEILVQTGYAQFVL